MIGLADRAKTLAAAFQAEHVDAVQLDRAIAQAAKEALERGETHYSDRPGILPLREKVVAYLQTLDLDTNAGNVVITCGVTEARFVAVQVLVERGGVVACADDVDVMRGAAILREAEAVAVSSPEDVPETATVLYVKDTQVSKWLEHAQTKNLWLIVELTGQDTLSLPSELAARTIIVADVGSTDITPWRVGFFAVQEGDVAKLRSFKQALTICSTNVSQWAVKALTSKGLVAHG